MLSRIDGHTPWKALREIGGLSPDDVDRHLERFAKAGFIVVEAAGGGAGAAPAAGAPETARRPEVDGSLDLSVELQERILTFEEDLDRSYHELLGVPRGVETKEVKRAYFRLSKEFHPDRYFRRNVGGYAERLDRIFKRICEAYELLADPTTRAEIERSLPPEPPAEGAYQGAGASERIGPERRPRAKAPAVPQRLRNLQRLRASFKVPKKLLVERQFKAKQFFRSAQAAAHEKRWLEASASMRLAIAFDPGNREYKAGLAGIHADVHRVRAEALIAQAASSDAQGDALKLLEEALFYKPCDAPLLHRAASLALELNELSRAAEHAESLCEIAPDDAAGHVLLARVLRRQGLRDRAGQAIDRAAELRPEDADVVAELRQQRRRGPVRR